MPRGHEHISFVFCAFRDIFSFSFLRVRLKWEKNPCAMFGCYNDCLFLD